MTDQKIRDIVAEHEKVLRFEHFTHRDAYDLGTFLAERVNKMEQGLAIAIRALNGAVLFQYLCENTCMDNQRWMLRKFNTVSMTEHASLAKIGKTPSSEGLSELDYAYCGGGIPVRLVSGELVAVATVSALPDLIDHQFLAEGMAAYLGIEKIASVVDEERKSST